MFDEPPEYLYHYCSNETLLSILRSSALHLTALSLSNDFLEGRWLQRLLRGKAEREAWNKEVIEKLTERMDRALIPAVGFCMSASPDILSQWRGYADNGAGCAIGIRSDILQSMRQLEDPHPRPLLHKIVYDERGQEERLTRVIDRMPQDVDFETRQMPSEYFHMINATFDMLYVLKNPAFAEEEEWRLIDLSHVPTVDRHFGRANLDEVWPAGFKYKSGRAGIVPYIEVPLRSWENPIGHVVVGPRNDTPRHVLKAVLREMGFGDVQLEKSSASFR